MAARTGLSPTPTLEVTVRLTVLETTDQRSPLIAAAQITAITALIAGSATEGWS